MSAVVPEDDVPDILFQFIDDWFDRHRQTRRRDIPTNVSENVARDLQLNGIRLVVDDPETLYNPAGELVDLRRPRG